jgi:acyl dehydratase
LKVRVHALDEFHSHRHLGALKRLAGRFSGMVMLGEDITWRREPTDAGAGAVRSKVRTSGGAAAMTQGVALLDA